MQSDAFCPKNNWIVSVLVACPSVLMHVSTLSSHLKSDSQCHPFIQKHLLVALRLLFTEMLSLLSFHVKVIHTLAS